MSGSRRGDWEGGSSSGQEAVMGIREEDLGWWRTWSGRKKSIQEQICPKLTPFFLERALGSGEEFGSSLICRLSLHDYLVMCFYGL